MDKIHLKIVRILWYFQNEGKKEPSCLNWNSFVYTLESIVRPVFWAYSPLFGTRYSGGSFSGSKLIMYIYIVKHSNFIFQISLLTKYIVFHKENYYKITHVKTHKQNYWNINLCSQLDIINCGKAFYSERKRSL